MTRKLLNISIVALIIGAVSFVATAQNPQNRGGNRPNATLTNIVSLEGVVESVNLRIGQGTPSFTLAKANGSKVTVITGPYYILLENNFAINVGDQMVVRAFPSLFENTYVAVELKNLTTGAALTLRDENGFPLWTRGGGPGGPGRGHYCGANWPIANPADIVSLEGAVGSVNMGIGQGFPSFTLTQAGGNTVTVITGPYYILLENDFEINVGDQMAVRAFPSLRLENTYVAIELKNLSTGAVLSLRDENGVPLWSNGPRRGRRF
ncbi:MAG: hypothetical protein HY314_06000 [Acidobacteria bacterium]|nr:hypothetical protein [Acidobacteriota bacterium]